MDKLLAAEGTVTATSGTLDGGEKKTYTREEIASFLADISKKMSESKTTYMQSMLALNHLLRQPNAEKLFDTELKEQARALWLQVKATGMHLNDPPLLFGLPALISEAKPESEDESDGTEEVVIDMSTVLHDSDKKKQKRDKREEDYDEDDDDDGGDIDDEEDDSFDDYESDEG